MLELEVLTVAGCLRVSHGTYIREERCVPVYGERLLQLVWLKLTAIEFWRKEGTHPGQPLGRSGGQLRW